MKRGEHDRFVRRIDAHFARTISVAEENELRQHLPECGACRSYYERHLLFESLDPRARGAEARLAVGLGIRRRRRTATPFVVGATAFAALALAAPMLGSTIASRREPEFAPRGTIEMSEAPHLMIYRLRPDRAPELVHGVVGPRDELAFAYTNPDGFERLLIFGVDEHRHVYWYHPAWSREGENPVGIPVAAGPQVHELAEAVTQRLDGRTLRIVGLFTRDSISVRQVERVVKDAPMGTVDFAGAIRGTVQMETLLEIEQR
jgi:hypothetical protein